MHLVHRAILDAEGAPRYESPHLGGPDPDVPARPLLEILLPHVERVIDRVMPEMLEGSRRCMDYARRVRDREPVAPNAFETLEVTRHHAVASGAALMARGILTDNDDVSRYGAGLSALWVARLLNDTEEIGRLQRELDDALMLTEYESVLREDRPAPLRVVWRAKGESVGWCTYFIVELIPDGAANGFAFYFSDRPWGKNTRWVRGSPSEVLGCVPRALLETVYEATGWPRSSIPGRQAL